MKKVLLCMLMAGLMMPAVAQRSPSVKNGAMITHISEECDLGISQPVMLPIGPETAVQAKWWGYAGISKSYDRQTQGSVYPMVQMHDDGFIGCTWTTEDNTVPFQGSSNPLRGVAYSCSKDGGKTWSWDVNDPETQENRIGGIPLYWPSYAQWGANGEVVLARSADTYDYNGMQILNGLVLLTRENKGEGEWNLTVVPYPEEFDPGVTGVMAWARMTTSGPNHQYIHIMSPLRTPVSGENLKHPVYYYRTQDGKTWDVEAASVPEMVGQEWPDGYAYTDRINFAVRGNTVACSFISMGGHGYVLRSYNNGDEWECIKFFNSPILRHLTTDDYADSIYCPAMGCVALDNNDKIHLAFSVIRSRNSDTPGTVSYWPWAWAQFLSYWNEDMPMIDGETDFSTAKIAHLLLGYPEESGYHGEYFDWDLSTEDQLYVKSITPKMPVIGYFIPVIDDHYYTFLDDFQEWAGKSYGQIGMFTSPQMAADENNTMHLVYLGLLDGGSDGDNWFRHPFHTSTPDGGKTWTDAKYLASNNLGLIDQEFAYLTLIGAEPARHRILMMAQTDAYAGVYTYYGDPPPDHSNPTNNFYQIFSVYDPVAINELGTSSLTMSVRPNPASGQVRVEFEGKGNITVYNMLGQTVYHAENVENQKDIPLNNLTSGVYFVTVRAGNAVATQKLVVK